MASARPVPNEPCRLDPDETRGLDHNTRLARCEGAEPECLHEAAPIAARSRRHREFDIGDIDHDPIGGLETKDLVLDGTCQIEREARLRVITREGHAICDNWSHGGRRRLNRRGN